MNVMKRNLGLGAMLSILVLTGCGATNYGGNTTRGLDDLFRDQLAAPATTAAAATDLPVISALNPRPQYRIGVNDVLTVVVWGRPDLGSTVPANSNNRRNVSTVDANGDIQLPFIGTVTVAGLSLKGAAVAIENAYQDIIPSPQVELEVVDYEAHPVLVNGQVQKPGTVFLSNALMTVGEALAAAEGPRTDGDLTRVLLTRDGQVHELDLWASEHGHNANLDILLRDGDKLFIPPVTENQFYVLGDVAAPGPYPIPSKGTTLVEGLARAGGINMDSASFDDLLLFRHTGTDSTVYKFTYFEAVTQGDIPLQPGDRIHVSQSNVAKVGYVLRNILPALSIITSVWIVDRIINEP